MSKKKKKKSTSNDLEVQNAAKTLYANIRFMSVDNPIKSIMLTSAVPNEGKTAVAMRLAQAIATSGKRVLIVETDMRRRSMASRLGVRPPVGIYAVLADAATLNEAISPTNTPNMYFLDAEPNLPNPADLISSKRFAQLTRTLHEAYDYVVYDMPPVGTFVDAAVMSTLVDATVLVVRPDLVKRDDLVYAYEQLQKAQANVIGICATFVEGTGSEYYYAYYTSSGERVRKSGDSKGHSSSSSSSGGSSSRSAQGFDMPRGGHRTRSK